MRRTLQLAAVAAVAALLVWPALMNGYPLLFPDTLDYIGQGRAVVFALLHARHPAFGGQRSAIYSLGIYPFHLDRWPWPVLALNAAAVVYAVYLTARSFSVRHALRNALAVLGALSVMTGMSWYICLLMPDVFGAPLYLALYLLVFARETLRRWEQGVLAVMAVFCAASHTTHLLIAALLCALLAVWKLVGWGPLAGRGRGLALAAGVIAVTAVAQVTVNARLYGRGSLGGNRPPYLEARIIADGPGRLYLEQHCGDHREWVLCRHVEELPDSDDAFLWGEGGIWAAAGPAEQAELRREELPLALATLRAYPGQELAVSWSNFAQQLVGFGLDDFDNNDYMQTHLDTVLPNARAAYDRSLQARSATPWLVSTRVQGATVLFSLGVLALLLPALVRGGDARRLGLVVVVATVLVANAAITGVLSEVDARYQARVVWLLPLLAALLLLDRVESASGAGPR
jgi:hypothetical protein